MLEEYEDIQDKLWQVLDIYDLFPEKNTCLNVVVPFPMNNNIQF